MSVNPIKNAWTASNEVGWSRRRYRATVKAPHGVTHFEGDVPADLLRLIADKVDLESSGVEIILRPLGAFDV